MTLNDDKVEESFESILESTRYEPESGNRYFTEKLPSAADILVNLKDRCCPPELVSTTILAERSFKWLPVCRFSTLNFNSVGVSIAGFSGKYLNWILRLFNLSIHVCVLLTEEEEEDDEEVCPRAAVFRDKITTTIIAIMTENNKDASKMAEENAKIRK